MFDFIFYLFYFFDVMELKYSLIFSKIYCIILVLIILFVFLLLLFMLGSGFKLMSKDLVIDVFKVISNFIIFLFIGLFVIVLM